MNKLSYPMEQNLVHIPTAGVPGMVQREGSAGGLLHECEVVRKTGRDAISTFLDSHNCFSVLRSSGKCVVFDTRIPIQLAFYALVEHGKVFLHKFRLMAFLREISI